MGDYRGRYALLAGLLGLLFLARPMGPAFGQEEQTPAKAIKILPDSQRLRKELARKASETPTRRANPLYEPSEPGILDGIENLFLNRKVTVSGQWWSRLPEYAVNGRYQDRNEHWAAEDIPVWLAVDLATPMEINAIHLYTWWDGKRYYQYLIEGSLDGEEWTPLVDQRENEEPAHLWGDFFLFPERKARYVRTTFTHNSASDKAGGHIIEIKGYHIPSNSLEREIQRSEAWEQVPRGLHGKFGSVDVRYPREEVPVDVGSNLWSGTAWRGERLNAQLVLWTRGASQVRFYTRSFRNEEGDELGPDALMAYFVRYVLADDLLVPDILDTAERLDLPSGTARPIWITIDVPAGAKPGTYRGRLTVVSLRHDPLAFDLEVEVLPLELPPPAEWTFHLDLWQNPYAVARYHHVEPWSRVHFELLEPHLRMLAAAGQKCLTTTIVHQPWGTQTYDPYESMVQWIRQPDGVLRFDFSVFDRYVEFAARCGFDRTINCYSMVPWTNRIRCLDEATGDYVDERVDPILISRFEEYWQPFLLHFVEHLEKKGWLGRVAIAMDERSLDQLKSVIKLVRRTAPELEIAQAGSNEPKLKDDIDDWCVYISPPLDPAIARERREKGLETTFYVCCNPPRPNTFTFSPPAEAAWLGLYAAAKGYTGFLRWAYDSWTEDPLYDTKHVTWFAGDCFLVYPNARSSIRFERLREGIQEFEKIRILREKAAASGRPEVEDALRELDARLARFTFESASQEPAASFVNDAKKAIEKLSRILVK